MDESTREPGSPGPEGSTSEEAANRNRSRGGARRRPRVPANRLAAVVAAVGLLLLPSPCGAQTLNGHPVVLDGSDKLLSWLPQQTAYSQIVQRVWNGFLNDIPVTQGCVRLIILAFFTINLAVDLLYALIDPRIEYR